MATNWNEVQHILVCRNMAIAEEYARARGWDSRTWIYVLNSEVMLSRFDVNTKEDWPKDFKIENTYSAYTE